MKYDDFSVYKLNIYMCISLRRKEFENMNFLQFLTNFKWTKDYQMFEITVDLYQIKVELY